MRLLSLELKNVCNHLDLRRDLHPGVTVITGANGRGKSTILLAIEAILAGDWSVFAGVKAENISQLAAAGSPVYGRLRLVHGERTLDITRRLRPAGAEVRIGDAPAETGERRVNEVIEETLGRPVATVARVLFTRQNGLYSFLVGRPADRAETFQELFGSADAGRLYDLLGRELERTPVIQETDEREVLRSRIAEAQHRRARLEERLALLPEASAGDAEAAARIIAAVADRKRVIASARDQRRKHRAALVEEEVARDELTWGGEYRAKCTTRSAEAKVAAKVAEAALSAWSAYSRAQQQRAAHVAELAAIEAAIAREQAPAPPPDAATAALIADFARDGATWYHDLASLQAFVDSFADGVAACPTCGTPSAAFGDRFAAAQDVLPRFRARYAAGREAYERERARIEFVARYEREMSRLRGQRERVAAQIAACEAVSPPSMSREDALATIEASDRSFRDLRSAAEREAVLAARHASAKEAARLFAEQRQALRESLAAPRPGRREYAAARVAADRLAKQAAERAEVVGQLVELDRQVGEMGARIVKVDALLREAAASEAWRGVVSRLRAVVHRDGLPQVVSRQFLAAIEGDVQSLLEEFNSPFRVRATDDLSFEALFADGRRQPAARLSPGQKMVLGLAFWVAVNAALAGELGFLALDEPTDSLDEVNRRFLELAIGRLKAISRDRGLQVLIVTHDKSLVRLADDAWDLGGW